MPSQVKTDLKARYAALLAERPNIIMTRYQGMNVAQVNSLRAKLRQQGVKYAVVKNNIFKIALAEAGLVDPQTIESTLVGPIAVAFTQSDLPVAAKILKEYKKENEKFDIMAGVMESTFYDAAGIEALAGLPSKEQVLATLAAALNGPATQVAGLVNNIMASLARAVKAVGEKNG